MAYHNYKVIERLVEAEQEFEGNRSHGLVLASGEPGANVIGWGHQLHGEDLAAWQRDAHVPGRMTYVVMSYATPIAWILDSGEVYITKAQFSNTTSRLQNIVRRAWAHRRFAPAPDMADA